MGDGKGSELEVIPDTRGRDHMPMHMTIVLGTNYNGARRRPDGFLKVRWSHDALAEGATAWLHRKTFIRKFEEALAANQGRGLRE